MTQPSTRPAVPELGVAFPRRQDAAFAALLRALREAAWLTQEDLAHRSGVSVRAIRNLELGKTRYPYLDTVELLAQGLALAQPTAERLRRSARPRGELMLIGMKVAPPPGGCSSLGPAPRQLPIDVRDFVGRRDELRRLDVFGACHVSPGTSLIAVLSGMAGVGKTGLAVRWAHLVRHRFPEGQLYVDLHHDGRQRSAQQVLPTFLRSLGSAECAVPPTTDEQSALFRTLVADRRMLILIDNARCACQVRPLLPATNRCLVLVTSRQPLHGLVARDGAYRLEVDRLSEAAAMQLLHKLIGGRVAADPAATAELVHSCQRLPRALRVAAEFAASYPALPLRSLLPELAIRYRPALGPGQDGEFLA